MLDRPCTAVFALRTSHSWGSHLVHQTEGIRDDLPVFHDRILQRLHYPLAWQNVDSNMGFDEWRDVARQRFLECLLVKPPEAPFDPVVVGEEDRGDYVAKRVVFNLTVDSRVLSYVLIPQGEGPFPAVQLLHDHGGRFDIGKEKVIRPFGEPKKRLDSAEQWVNECYGGRWIGDELATRGYLCFATDMFFWSDRGGAEPSQMGAVSANLTYLGMSMAGLIAHEDLAANGFVASMPEVDSTRIAAMGLSVGCLRTWQLAALTEQIAAGVAICWMSTIADQMQPGVNLTTGGYPMMHPNLYNFFDFPDVASIACPKPMLFYNGSKDALFSVASVNEAYEKMHVVWDSQNASDRLHTRMWDVPHEFNQEMQKEAFEWLDGFIGNGSV